MGQLNFPTNPTPGQTHTVGVTTWVWNGAAWIKQNNAAYSSLGTLTVTNFLSVTSNVNSTSTTTGAIVISGGIGVGQDANVGGRLTAESIKIAEAILDSTLVSTSTTATVLIDSYSLDEYRAAKYLLQVDSGTGTTATFQISEIYLIADNNGNVRATEYGLVYTAGPLGDFTADIDSNNVRLFFTADAATDKVIAVLRTAIKS